MLREMLVPILLFVIIASTQGRAVNISNTWVLPEEGFPVFYRYFRDRISWYEADAVCQFHHANLVTVDTTAQYDAVRAYLKELDISSAVWVGLIRSNPDGDFTWTDYRGLSNEGYWSAAPDARAAPLCAAADPAADYRWQARACGGPMVASFICELPVPQWALGTEGCMVKALPALTVLYLPESAAVQLTADCGLAGVKRVHCTGNVKREELLKNLSCSDYDLSTVSDTPLATDFSFNFTEDVTTSDTPEDSVSTEHDTSSPKPLATQPTIAPFKIQDYQVTKYKNAEKLIMKLKNLSYKNVNLDMVHDNNLQSNDIPKNPELDDLMKMEQKQKLEDEKNMQHKLLHDELARHGNFETIFSLPTDHFVPPLVMAKAKISDDMTVLSLAEKHAQQLAEQHTIKHILPLNDMSAPQPSTEKPNKSGVMDQPLVLTMQPNTVGEKLEKSKQRPPKKYLLKDKYDGLKVKAFKIDNKLTKFEKMMETSTGPAETYTRKVEITTKKVVQTDNMNENASLELDVVLKEPINEKPVPKIDNSEEKITESMTSSPHNTKKITTEGITTKDSLENSTPMENITMTHEVIKITLINDKLDDTTQRIIEVTTRVPELTSANNIAAQKSVENSSSDKEVTATTITSSDQKQIVESITVHEITKDRTVHSENSSTETGSVIEQASTVVVDDSQVHAVTKTSEYVHEETTADVTNAENTAKEDVEFHSITEEVSNENEDDNSTHISPEGIDDFHSPLLSGASEPLHRPNRSRRPQTPPNRISKFSPFRILG